MIWIWVIGATSLPAGRSRTSKPPSAIGDSTAIAPTHMNSPPTQPTVARQVCNAGERRPGSS
ncbi:MAG: hypothetical protein R3D59_08975 [Paracoccaceae bacterium]